MNLPKDKADEYRAQARRLRERLEGYLAEHPDFTLKKMLLSGSLAKGTALRSLNDIDVACYISGADAPSDVAALLDYLAERLRKAFPNFSPDRSAADLQRDRVVPRHRTRRRRRADPLRGRSGLVRLSRQPGRRLPPQDQHPAATWSSSRKRKDAQRDALRAGRRGW